MMNLTERHRELAAQIAVRYAHALGVPNPSEDYQREVARNLIEARRRGYRVDFTRIVDAPDRVVIHDVAQAMHCAAGRPYHLPHCLQRRGRFHRTTVTEPLFA